MVLKQWGMPRSGTNYARAAMESGWDVKVLSTILGHKHWRPTDIVDWNPSSWCPRRWGPDEALILVKIGKATRKWCASLHIEDETKALVERDGLRHVFTVRDPYAWLAAMLAPKLGGLKKAGDDKARLLLVWWLRLVGQYDEFMRNHAATSAYLRHEDMLRGQSTVAAMAAQLGMKKRSTPTPRPWDKRIEKTGDHAVQFTTAGLDRRQYEERKFLPILGRRGIDLVNDVVSQDLMMRWGYERIT